MIWNSACSPTGNLLVCLNFTSLNYIFRWISGSLGFIMKQDKAKRLWLEGLYWPLLFTCSLRKQTNEEEARQARDYKYGRVMCNFTDSRLSCFCSEINWSYSFFFLWVTSNKFFIVLKNPECYSWSADPVKCCWSTTSSDGINWQP